MKAKSSDRSAMLIVRLWIEANHETGMRIRITQTLNSMGAERSVAVVASVDEICAVVKEWAEAFEHPSSLDGNGKVSTG